MNHEAAPVRLPGNTIIESILFDLFQHLMQLERERKCHSASLTRYGSVQMTVVPFVGVIMVVMLYKMTIMHLGSLGVFQLASVVDVVLVHRFRHGLSFTINQKQ